MGEVWVVTKRCNCGSDEFVGAFDNELDALRLAQQENHYGDPKVQRADITTGEGS